VHTAYVMVECFTDLGQLVIAELRDTVMMIGLSLEDTTYENAHD
jgi:hypothetical protein